MGSSVIYDFFMVPLSPGCPASGHFAVCVLFLLVQRHVQVWQVILFNPLA